MYDRKQDLFEYEPELTFREISDKTGLHRNTVYNAYVSGMRKVTRYFERLGYETIQNEQKRLKQKI